MGRSFGLASKVKFKPGECAVEIGSERGDLSTSYFDDLFKGLKVPFYTVDPHPTVYTHYRMTGEEFLLDEFPKLGYKIRFAYLDGFDWTYPDDHFDDPLHIIKQVSEYSWRGVQMNNENCQASHLEIAKLVDANASDQCFILCDDTWLVGDNGFDGKGGSAIPWLLSHGYKVITSGPDHVGVKK